jgi:hypothetical protein
MSSLRGFKIDMMTNQNPLNYSLQFSTPFSFMAATLVENVDFLNRQIFTLYRMGVIPKENLIQKDLIRQIQNVFSLPRKWRYTGVTRRDILEKNQKAKLAEELLGEIPNAVLNQEIKFTFLPKGHIDEKANKTLSIE